MLYPLGAFGKSQRLARRRTRVENGKQEAKERYAKQRPAGLNLRFVVRGRFAFEDIIPQARNSPQDCEPKGRLQLLTNDIINSSGNLQLEGIVYIETSKHAHPFAYIGHIN